jgi:hypothetical protein
MSNSGVAIIIIPPIREILILNSSSLNPFIEDFKIKLEPNKIKNIENRAGIKNSTSILVVTPTSLELTPKKRVKPYDQN